MKVIVISDTHGLHHQLNIPLGDILIHAGDVSALGTKVQIKDFLDWFERQPHPYKIFIAGNHDFYFEKNQIEEIQALIPKGVIYLNEEMLEINGLKIWGSPFTPIPTKRWAFNKERGQDIQKHWDLIPKNLDILIVHGPPKGILDKILNGEHVGCQNLLETIQKKKPKMLISGHIHESRGIEMMDSTLFINASSVDRHKTKVFPPFVLAYKENRFEVERESLEN